MKRRWVPAKSQLVRLLASSLTIGFANPAIAANLLVDQAAFLAAAGPVTVETFESAPLSGTADSGALPSISFADFDVASVPTAVKVLGAPYYGHRNTTPGGSRYLSIDTDVAGASGYVTLTFDAPIYSIGFFLIGIEHTSLVETRPVEILLDGIEYPIPTTPYDGNRYVGLLSSTPFTTLEIHADPVDSFWSIDDVAFSTQASAASEIDVFFDEAPFLEATAWLSTEDFEAAPVSGTLNGGALPQIAFADLTASSTPDAVKVFDAPYFGNHNTTPGGSHYLAFDTDLGSVGSSATLAFHEPVNDVGFFLVNADHIDPTDPMPVTVVVAGTEYPIPAPGTSGEVFFGVVRESTFSQVEIDPDEVDSFWSIDDVSYVPEPSAQAMAWIGAGVLCFLASIRRRRARTA